MTRETPDVIRDSSNGPHELQRTRKTSLSQRVHVVLQRSPAEVLGHVSWAFARLADDCRVSRVGGASVPQRMATTEENLTGGAN